MSRRICPVIAAIAGLLLSSSVGRADYVTQSFQDGSLNVTFEAYDGTGPAGGGLDAGQVRMTFHFTPPPAGGIEGIVTFEGLQSVGFNTDLSLAPSQISGPAGWLAKENAKLGPGGAFNWVVGTSSNYQNPVSVLIAGLGSDATFAHFNVGSTGGSTASLFGVRFVAIDFTDESVDVRQYWGSAGSPVAQTPEPSSLALVGAGAVGLALARRRRKLDVVA